MMKERRGFTLIELLVVIAIIAILAAILFPVFAQAREAARTSTSLSNTKQLGLGMLMYVQDYDEHFPAWNWGYWCNGQDPVAEAHDSGAFWTMAIYPYVKNTAVYRCPDDVLQNDDSWATCGTDGGINDLFGPHEANGAPCPSSDTNCNPNYVSYAIPENLDPNYPSNKLAGITSPATWMMIGDAGVQLADVWVWQAPTDGAGGDVNEIAARMAFANDDINWGMMWDCCQPASYYITKYGDSLIERVTRHHGGNNVGYVDGHAKYHRWNQLTYGLLTTGDTGSGGQ